jgi:Spy/CpxP family protein refolding chaperone
MTPKLNRIDTEYDRNAAKIAELQARQQELERQRTELKNNDILELVHAHDLDFAALSALIQKMENNRPAVMAGEMEIR